MKKLFVLIVCLLFLSCSKNTLDEACGCTNPQKNLPWLKELIQKAKTDETGNYWGCIWLEKYNGQDIFVTNMLLGSGGVAYWAFDCHGNILGGKDLSIFVSSQMKKNIVIYSNKLNYCK